MSRREFPRAIKVAVIKRATRDGVTYCEKCGALAKRWQIDHIRPDGLLGEPTIENAQLLGECCYTPKNADDTAKIAKAKRREAKALGAKKPAGRPIVSVPFPPPEDKKRSDRTGKVDKSALPALPRRPMFA